MSHKYNQITKFIEILARLVNEQYVKRKREQFDKIEVVDLGSGKAYLTFAAHYFLYHHYFSKNRTNSLRTRGIEIRPDLIENSNRVARSLGAVFDGLEFTKGSISESMNDFNDHDIQNTLRIYIALHACDTASDDAIYSAIQSNADIVLIAPCCHKEIRIQLNDFLDHDENSTPDIVHNLLINTGIYRERISEMITDHIRKLLLQYCGYLNTKIFEFVDNQQTSKNIMITAVKDYSNGNRSEYQQNILNEIEELKKKFGIKRQKLLDYFLSNRTTDHNTTPNKALLFRRKLRKN